MLLNLDFDEFLVGWSEEELVLVDSVEVELVGSVVLECDGVGGGDDGYGSHTANLACFPG